MCVCRLTSWLFVDLRHVLTTDEFQTSTSGHKWRPGHRDIGNKNDERDTQRESDQETRNVPLAITINKAPGHKWQPGRKWWPGHGDTGNINDDRESQREITDWDTGTQEISMTTGTQKHNYNGDAGGTGWIYKWRLGHRECSISNHHQQSTGTQMRTGIQGI